MSHYNVFRISFVLLNFCSFALPQSNITVDNVAESGSVNLTTLKNQQMTDGAKTQILPFLIIFSLGSSLSLLINMRVFYIVFITSKRKSRPANILVAHLSTVVITFTCAIYLFMLEETKIISLTVPGLCHVHFFLIAMIYSVFPLNAAAIIWVRSRSDAIILRKSFTYRSIGMMWAISFCASLPTFLMVESVTNSDTNKGKCTQKLILGSFEVTTAYEGLRLFMFNIMVCLYLIKATIKIQASLRYLDVFKTTQNGRMMNRIRQVRFVHLQTLVFVAGWFPDGVRIFLYRLFSRLGWTTNYIQFLIPSVFLNYAVFILCPLSYVFLLEEISTANIFAPCVQRNASSLPLQLENGTQAEPEIFGWRVDPELLRKSNIPSNQKSISLSNKPGNKTVKNNNSFELSEMSRISTVGVTETSKTLPVSVTKAIPRKDPVYVQDSSIPALSTPSTVLELENLVIELHSEPKQYHVLDEIAVRKIYCETAV